MHSIYKPSIIHIPLSQQEQTRTALETLGIILSKHQHNAQSLEVLRRFGSSVDIDQRGVDTNGVIAVFPWHRHPWLHGLLKKGLVHDGRKVLADPVQYIISRTLGNKLQWHWIKYIINDISMNQYVKLPTKIIMLVSRQHSFSSWVSTGFVKITGTVELGCSIQSTWTPAILCSVRNYFGNIILQLGRRKPKGRIRIRKSQFGETSNEKLVNGAYEVLLYRFCLSKLCLCKRQIQHYGCALKRERWVS